jgi:hypothetical protein
VEWLAECVADLSLLPLSQAPLRRVMRVAGTWALAHTPESGPSPTTNDALSVLPKSQIRPWVTSTVA